ncbi:MAG: primosomal protein N' [Alphaproteobacteria bacterium]|nr:primosomal protein N' [Alphaproteobacteria bacterium]
MSQSQLFGETQIVAVLVPYPVDKAYSYAVPDGMTLRTGDYVTVPLGGRAVLGVVWDDSADLVFAKNLKTVLAKHETLPSMPAAHRTFIDWTARYTMAPRGAVLKMALSVPKGLEEGKGKGKPGYRLAHSSAPGERLSPKQQKILDILSDRKARTAAQITKVSGCTAGVVKTMVKNGILLETTIAEIPPCARPDSARQGPSLSEAQRRATDSLKESVLAQKYRVDLLDGVTGAGKTETYFEAVAAALKQDKQVLILLPEIALSNAFLDRFESRFGCPPALWHSQLTPAQRQKTWRGVVSGQSKVIVGARSALYLPYVDLGLIVVDEEHDPAYKQEDNVIYHARDMAVVRAHSGDIPLVLVSATPSLETMHNVWEGRYTSLHLPDRHGGARLPDVHVIDMRTDKPERGRFLSPPLKEALAAHFKAGEQSLLFLNRRGYAPLTLCRHCGHRMACPRCTAWLVAHKATGRLHCHHCDFSLPAPDRCPACGEEDSLVPCGPGVERIFEEVTDYFPQARVKILASDTAAGPAALKEMLDEVRAHKIDILIGTQIIAKGHHFPNLTLVGVVDADLGLQGGDLRAAERTYQLLHQVAGRAGREEKPGHVYLQTWFPDNKVMQALAAGDRDAFLSVEAAERETAGMPPYSRLAGIVVAGKKEDQVIAVSNALGRGAPQGARIQTLGPADAPFYRLRGYYRRRLLVRADKKIDLQKTLAAWIGGVKVPSTVRVYIDIDPQGFL